MAREKDEGKRRAILATAKRLFAERGFHATSVADLARAVGLPVGSIYTYFSGKDALLSAVLEEGWSSFFESLCEAFTRARRPEEKLALLVYRFIPELLGDLDLISIILAEAVRFPGLEDKLERLTALIAEPVVELAAAREEPFDFPPSQAKAALILYLLGSLDTVRIARSAGLSLGPEDVIAFIRLSVENSFHIKLGPELLGPQREG